MLINLEARNYMHPGIVSVCNCRTKRLPYQDLSQTSQGMFNCTLDRCTNITLTKALSTILYCLLLLIRPCLLLFSFVCNSCYLDTPFSFHSVIIHENISTVSIIFSYMVIIFSQYWSNIYFSIEEIYF